MNTKSCILAVFISLLSISSFAQVEAEIHRPSINAEQFGFALKAETALNKGQLSVNIPLMTLKGKGYDLPISLTFYSGDVTCATEASPIGLGWALMAGGVIAATIRGSDDIEDYTEDGKTDHHTDSDYIEKAVKSTFPYNFIDRIKLNSMPDEYTYSIPGHSGTIEVSVDKNKAINRTLFPDESYKIEKTTNGYCIIADDGTKFFFEAKEWRATGTWPESRESTSYFLTEIKTIKGGQFFFNYEDEDYCDLSKIRDYVNDWDCDIYHTKRIKSIESLGYGSITFETEERVDRGETGRWSIPYNKKSKRISKIELRDENNHLVKGYELDNSGTFKLEDKPWEDPSTDWYYYRQKLSSIAQYDSIGNKLPPYKFTYDYRFSKPKLQYAFSDKDYDGYYIPYDSWTSNSGRQAYVDLYGNSDGSNPYCWIDNNQPQPVPTGWTGSSGDGDKTTAGDYFCLTNIVYPNGAVDAFTYKEHKFSKINNTENSYSAQIQGRRLDSKMRYGTELTQRTKYVYRLHDSNYKATGPSSGVLTNPSIHSATYYIPEYTLITDFRSYGWVLRASRLSSGKPFNSFMGPPVCYTEVEEITYDGYGDSLRTIHYFDPQIVSPPVNYVLIHPQNSMPELIKVENRIFGKKSGFRNGMESCNNGDYTYMAYPVGDFCNIAYVVDQPKKEIIINKDGKVRSIKRYSYDIHEDDISKKYGYKIISPRTDYTLISKSEYITRRIRLMGTNTITYYYDGEKCDSVCENYGIQYNKGRTYSTYSSREDENNGEGKSSLYFYPDDIKINNLAGNNADSTLAAINGLIDKNIVADPIKTIVMHNGATNGGECKNYQMVSGKPLLKSLYKVKNTSKIAYNPPTMYSDTINYHVDLYKEGEILTYDANLNPEYVRLNDTLDRIYVWGYGGQYPIAVIDNMDGNTFQSLNLKAKILQLQSYRKIETEDKCASLRSLNASIRSMLPESAHITTYTYDPYFGMTSETDDSNLGIIYIYDTFGRLTAKHDENYKKLEEYNYHLPLQK